MLTNECSEKSVYYETNLNGCKRNEINWLNILRTTLVKIEIKNVNWTLLTKPILFARINDRAKNIDPTKQPLPPNFQHHHHKEKAAILQLLML